MLAGLIVLYAFSVVLPLTGLFRIWRTARRDARRYNRGGIVIVSAGNIANDQVKAIQWDFLWIGLGVVSGGIAGIWSLFL